MVIKPPPLESRRALLSWTLRVLRAHDVKPRKRLSQSFLVEPLAIREIIGWIKAEKPRSIVEIGAGLGTLTYHTALHVSRVIAVELDPRLARITRDTVGELGNVEVVVGDAMKTPLTGEAVVSSLPYHIAGPMIARILRENTVRKAALILQAELAEKLASPPGSRKYGRISAYTQFLAEIRLGRKYGSRSFYPAPKIASMTVFLKRIRDYDQVAEAYENIIRCLFTQRNKKAVKIISICTGLDASWIPGEARVKDLAPRQIEVIAHAWLRRREQYVE